MLWLATGCLGAYGQSSTNEQPPNSLNPNHVKRYYAPKAAKKVKSHKVKVKHTAQYEFYERVEKAAKEKQRILKKLAKPQYSNPLYFGHKRMPKKRPPHKMRFCEVCHIRH